MTLQYYLFLSLLLTLQMSIAIQNGTLNTALARLDAEFKILANTVTPKITQRFISEPLLGKTMGALLTTEQLRIANVAATQPIIFAHDPKLNLYQLRVLHQKESGSCSTQTTRNALYMMHALQSNQSNFPALYTNMLSQTNFEASQIAQICPEFAQGLNFKETQAAFKEIIARGSNACSLSNNSCLPNDSALTINAIVEFVPVLGFFNDLYQTGAYQKDFFKLAIDYLAAIEPIEKLNEIAEDIACLAMYYSEPLVHRVQEFSQKATDFFAIDLSLWTITHHATCLVVNKVNNTIEFIFMDSLNNVFDTTHYKNYQFALQKAVKFTTNYQYLENTLVRLYYLTAIYYSRQAEESAAEKSARGTNFLQGIPSLFKLAYEDFKKENLLKNPVYQATYKQEFINKIKEYAKRYPAFKQEYKKTLALFEQS